MALSAAAATFLTEVTGHCRACGTDIFDFTIEIWSAFYWMPWNVYVGGKSMSFSSNHLERATLNELAAAGHLEVVKEWGKEDIDPESLEIEHVTYRVVL